MTKLESFEDWAQKTLAECSGINEQETFNKAKTELELELAVKKVTGKIRRAHNKINSILI